MQDGAIAHFHIDGMQNCKVPDDHMIKHVHALKFWRAKTCFLEYFVYFKKGA